MKIQSNIGMSSSIAVAECIVKSNWGAHEIARKENNLFLLEKDPFLKSKGVELDGKVYRTYDNWLEFSVDLSDHYVFTKSYDKVLEAKNLDQQLDLLNCVEGYSKDYCGKIETMIEKYGLWEFDLFY